MEVNKRGTADVELHVTIHRQSATRYPNQIRYEINTKTYPFSIVSGKHRNKAPGFVLLFLLQDSKLRSSQIEWVCCQYRHRPSRHTGYQAFKRSQTARPGDSFGHGSSGRVLIGQQPVLFGFVPFLHGQKVRLDFIKNHELYAAVGEHSYQCRRVALPQRREALLVDNFERHPGHVTYSEMGRRYLVHNLYPIDGRHEALGHHPGQATRQHVARLLGQILQSERAGGGAATLLLLRCHLGGEFEIKPAVRSSTRQDAMQSLAIERIFESGYSQPPSPAQPALLAS